MKCLLCGKSNQDGERFCSNCGKNFLDEPIIEEAAIIQPNRVQEPTHINWPILLLLLGIIGLFFVINTVQMSGF